MRSRLSNLFHLTGNRVLTSLASGVMPTYRWLTVRCIWHPERSGRADVIISSFGLYGISERPKGSTVKHGRIFTLLNIMPNKTNPYWLHHIPVRPPLGQSLAEKICYGLQTFCRQSAIDLATWHNRLHHCEQHVEPPQRANDIHPSLIQDVS